MMTEQNLSDVSNHLLRVWADGLLKWQIINPEWEGLHGGIMCPACCTVHGRIGDLIYPLVYLADETGESKYLEDAMLVYDWMERTVSFPDGSWVNEVNTSLWKGITVFGAVGLAGALIHHESLLDNRIRVKWRERLCKAADYLYTTFNINTGCINYPATCSYALSLIGTYLDRKDYMNRGRELAHEVLPFFSPTDKLLTGEGGPYHQSSPKGCFSVDLGYNVEESLPALVLYSRLTNDNEVLEVATDSLKSHLEFMLPDGAWDNSWGTRNFKWTYWGSRTSDGCQTGYALLANQEPVFYHAALQNVKLLEMCTHNGLLHGGPHYSERQISPCIHHSFCHAKTLTAICENRDVIKKTVPSQPIVLPRELEYGVKEFRDIQTWLVSKGKWRATVTGYDREYVFKNGHASGGALTMLYHLEVGPVIVASMNHYSMPEPINMQMDKDPFSMPLTPRFELIEKDIIYQNISDLRAKINYYEKDKEIVFVTQSQLVDEDQNPPESGSVTCEIVYTFSTSEFRVHGKYNSNVNQSTIRFVIPIISVNREKVEVISDTKIAIHKLNGIVMLEADQFISKLSTSNGRIFNFVPGMEAVPLAIHDKEFEIKIDIFQPK